MRLTTEKSKKQKIYQILEDEILNKRLAPGERLASRRDMAVRFGCSDTVINEVCNLLEERKMIVRKPKSGTFINPQMKFGSSRLVVLIISMDTENFENYINTFLQEADAAEILPMICRVTPINFADTMNRIRKRSPEKILFDLEGRLFPLELVHALSGDIPHIFVNRWEWDETPENAVVTDYASVYAEGIRFLREKHGIKKILFVNAHKYQMPFRQKIMEELECRTGLSFGRELIPFSFEEIQNEPENLIDAVKKMPDAIFAVSDYYIVKLLELAEKICPELLSLPKAGTFDMLYSSFPGHVFPSVPLDLGKMWRSALSYSRKESKPLFIKTAKIRSEVMK